MCLLSSITAGSSLRRSEERSTSSKVRWRISATLIDGTWPKTLIPSWREAGFGRAVGSDVRVSVWVLWRGFRHHPEAAKSPRIAGVVFFMCREGRFPQLGSHGGEAVRAEGIKGSILVCAMNEFVECRGTHSRSPRGPEADSLARDFDSRVRKT